MELCQCLSCGFGLKFDPGGSQLGNFRARLLLWSAAPELSIPQCARRHSLIQFKNPRCVLVLRTFIHK